MDTEPYGDCVLPLFPLGTVLFPGLVLPLHVFEERYRQLVHDLLALPEEDRLFGVVAIREGREVGTDGVRALFEVGCAARLQSAEGHPDGTFEVVTVGDRLFRLLSLSDDRPYFSGEVDWLPDDIGDPDLAKVLDASVRTAFVDYLAALSGATGDEIEASELPDDPLVLGHLVSASVLLDLQDRQDLLDQPDGCARLRRALSVLRREAGLLRTLGAAPAPELARSPYSAN